MNKSAHLDFPKIGDCAELKVTFSGQYDANPSIDGVRIVTVESEPTKSQNIGCGLSPKRTHAYR
ncbi:MAG: hypothetical protein WCF81_23470 [Roseiarcus sp.]